MAYGAVENASSQQMSVALNQGMINFSPKNISSDDRETDRTSRGKSAREMDVARLMEKSQTGKLAAEVLKPFFSKLAQVGITLGAQNNNSGKTDEELEKILGRQESFEDIVELKSDTPVISEVKRLKREGDEQARQGFGRGAASDEALALIKEYSSIFLEYLDGQNPALFGRLKDLKEKLKLAGVSEDKLLKLEADLKSGQKVDISEIVKEVMLLEALASGQIEKLTYKRGMQDLINGMDPSDVPEVVEKAREKAKAELQSFVLEELENVLVRKTYLQDKDFKEAYKLMNLAEKTGLDYGSWLNDVWPKKKDDHGLYLLDVPHSATGMNVDTSTDNPSNRAPKHGFEYEKQDENEVLVNRLRALYMQRALKGDAFTHLKTEFKIRKLKNGLFKLGIFTKDLEEQVKHEAEIIAKVKIIEMLKEGLIERATFYDLAGPAHELVEKKIKGLMKNAERLGMPISAEEFNLMRDNANRRVFELSRRELEEGRDRRRAKDSPKLEKKEKHLIRLLTRLREESNIEESFASSS